MWPFKSKEHRDEREQARGYRWAAAQLLKGAPPKELQANVECAYHFGDSSPFDSGISDALSDWKKKTGEEYDCMN